MRYLPIAFATTLLFTVGCSSSSDNPNANSANASNDVTDGSVDSDTDPETGTLTPPVINTEGTLIRQLADGFFVSTDKLQTGENASGGIAMGHWTVEFALDTVSWSYSDVVEVGTYASDDTSSTGTAEFAGRDIAFELNGGDLIWDSREYLRTAPVLVDSQETLVSYLDNSRYNSVEQFDIGETATGELVLGNWSLQFDDDEVTWYVQDTAIVGTYTYTGKSSFQVSLGDNNYSAYLLDDNEIMFESAVYKRVFASQFNSQESLEALLNGKTYQSLDPQPVGETINGAQAFGSWYINFVEDTFTWDYQDVSEAGTYRYLDDDSFTVILPGRDLTVAVEGNDIVFDGVRYRRNF